MIRDRQLLINGYLLNQLRLVAEIKGIDCAETVAEAWLQERLDGMPEIRDLANMRAKARKAADEEWAAKYAKPEEKLP